VATDDNQVFQIFNIIKSYQRSFHSGSIHSNVGADFDSLQRERENWTNLPRLCIPCCSTQSRGLAREGVFLVTGKKDNKGRRTWNTKVSAFVGLLAAA